MSGATQQPRKTPRQRDYRHEHAIRAAREAACERHLFSSVDYSESRNTGHDKQGKEKFVVFRTCLRCGARVSLSVIDWNSGFCDWIDMSAEDYRDQEEAKRQRLAERERNRIEEEAERGRRAESAQIQGKTAGKQRNRATARSDKKRDRAERKPRQTSEERQASKKASDRARQERMKACQQHVFNSQIAASWKKGTNIWRRTCLECGHTETVDPNAYDERYIWVPYDRKGWQRYKRERDGE